MGCGFITFGKSLFTILKTVVPKQFGCKNTKPPTQAREFVYIKLPHLLENLSIQLASKIQVTSYIFLQKWENQTFYIFSTYKNTAPVAVSSINAIGLNISFYYIFHDFEKVGALSQYLSLQKH